MLCNIFAGTGNARIQLQVPTSIYAGEAAIVNCTGRTQDFQHAMPSMSLTSRDDCTILQDSRQYRPTMSKNYYQKSFIVICKKGSHTIECRANSNIKHNSVAVQLQGMIATFYT